MVPMGLGSLVCPIGWGKLLSSPQTTLAKLQVPPIMGGATPVY